LCTDVGEIAEAVLDGLSALAVPPYVLLGHSVGGLTALRVAAAERTPVAAVVVCATPPPDAGPSLRFDVGLTDADLLTALAPLGGVSELLITVPRLLSALMPVLRADLAAFNAEMDAWRSGSALRAPAVPLIAVGAADDAFLPLAVFNHWRTSFPAAHVRSVPGRHFFPQDQPAPLAAILEEVHPPAAGDFVLTSGG
jgi:surfactin synthase thioesterase subunit